MRLPGAGDPPYLVYRTWTLCAIDFNEDLVLMGHDGPGHIAFAEGKTKVPPLNVFHSKVGRKLSYEMSVKHGPATLLSLGEILGDLNNLSPREGA